MTGASDGIGHAFAQALCSKGFNVLLHGRNPEKLAGIKAELEKQYPNVRVQAVIADAFDYNADLDKIVSTCEALPGKLTVLVNNVGGVPLEPEYGSFSEINKDFMDNLINLNARFPAQLTRALTPLLASNSPSLIMNMTSLTAMRGLPYFTTYSATKSFNYNFSQGLKTEMMAEGHDVEVLGIIVGNVMSGRNKDHIAGFTCTSRQLANEALQRVGCGEANVWGWYRHALQWRLMSMVPQAIMDRETAKAIRARKVEHEKKR